MNKKAIMLKFLVTIILTIIIFAPTIMFLSKFFQSDEQALDSFDELVKEIKELSKGKVGDKKSLTLILDPDTAIIKFDSTKKKIQSDYQVVKKSGQTTYAAITQHFFIYPSQCLGDCLVLCRDFISDTIVGAAPHGALTEQIVQKSLIEITPTERWTVDTYKKNYVCQKIKPVDVGEYKITDLVLTRMGDRPRRVLIHLEKTNSGIIIKGGYEKELLK